MQNKIQKIKHFLKNLFNNKISISIIVSSIILGSSLIGYAVINMNQKSEETKQKIISDLLNADKIFAGLPFKDNEYILGNTKNKITVLIYSDFECPFCKKLQEDTIQKLQEKYKSKTENNKENILAGDIGIVYRHFAQSYHDKAPDEINASLCTRELYGQNTYINFINRIYKISPTNNGLDLSLLPEISKYSVELANKNNQYTKKSFDQNEFISCLNNKTYNQEFMDDYKDAAESGLDGTPYSLIIYNDGDRNMILSKVSGARDISYFEKIINQLLKIK